MKPIYTHLQTLADQQARRLDPIPGQAASWHLWRPTEVNAVTLALAAQRPLLVCGEPGSGKSQLARACASALGWHMHAATLHARSEVADLLYQFDAVARLADAQAGTRKPDASYWQPQALWLALNWGLAHQYGSLAGSQPPALSAAPTGHVVLIDEIDKAPSEVPNGLLEVLGERCFNVPGLGIRVAGVAGADGQSNAAWPLIIITTNQERELPDAFVRRCVVLSHAPEPAEGYRGFLIRHGLAHFGPGRAGGEAEIDLTILEAAASQLAQDRERARLAQIYQPGLAEYLDLLYALHDIAPADTAEQWQWLDRLNQYAYLKTANDDDGEANFALGLQQNAQGERQIARPTVSSTDKPAP